MKHIYNKIISLLIVFILLYPSSSLIYAESDQLQLSMVIDHVINSMDIIYDLEDETVIEHITFTDIDGTPVVMRRSINADGSGELVTHKSSHTNTLHLTTQDYQLFLRLLDSPPPAITSVSTQDQDLNNSHYTHLFIASATHTMDSPTIAQIHAGGINIAISKIIQHFNPPAGVATHFAACIYSIIDTHTPSKMIIDHSIHKVHFSYDDVYYTHCYHELIRSYDSSNHLLDTTKVYYQSEGR